MSKKLIDTNILVYARNTRSWFYDKAKEIRDQANRGEIEGCISPQNLAEYYRVITDPRKIEKPLSVEEASRDIERYLRAMKIEKLTIDSNTISRAAEMARRYQIQGVKTFDLWLIATMLSNGVDTIITANEDDFKNFKEIRVINPFK